MEVTPTDDPPASPIRPARSGLVKGNGCDPAGVVSFASRIRGCRFAQPPATGGHPFRMTGRRRTNHRHDGRPLLWSAVASEARHRFPARGQAQRGPALQNPHPAESRLEAGGPGSTAAAASMAGVPLLRAFAASRETNVNRRPPRCARCPPKTERCRAALVPALQRVRGILHQLLCAPCALCGEKHSFMHQEASWREAGPQAPLYLAGDLKILPMEYNSATNHATMATRQPQASTFNVGSPARCGCPSASHTNE